jgi:hypothetical protein
MGTLVRFPLGGGANALRLDRFVTSTGLPLDVLSLDHRHGTAIVWRMGDDGTLDETLSPWRACGARVVDSRDRRGAA